MSSTTREGSLISLAIQGEPGDTLFMLLNVAPDCLFLQNLKGVLVPSLAQSLVLPFGSLPGSGALVARILLPELGTGLEGIPVFVQMVHSKGAGNNLLGAPTAALMLDSAIP